jgi:hypothetical protein
MKTLGIGTKISRFMEIRKYEKQQNYLNKYVHLDNNINDKAYKQIDTAKSGIANYLSQNNMAVTIKDAQSLNVAQNNPYFKNKLQGKLNVLVTDLETGESEHMLVNGLVDKTTQDTSFRYSLAYPNNDGVIRQTVNNTEDTMLRSLYRGISDMVFAIKNRK